MDITAFVTPEVLVCYKILPFGLTNSPALFNRKIRQVLAGLRGVEVFINYFIIHSSNFEDHVQLLRIVLQRFRNVHMTVNAK